MPRRCMDCPLDATHTLQWYAHSQRWWVRPTRNQQAVHLYCLTHAQTRARVRNARGVLPPMAQLKRLLARTPPKERS